MENRYIIEGKLICSSSLLAGLINKYKNLFIGHKNIMVHSQKVLPLILAIHLCEELKLNLFICHSFFTKNDVADYVNEYDIDLLIYDEIELTLCYSEYGISEESTSEANINIFTTGTTGKPKLARHSWESISMATKHVSSRLRDKQWLMAYSFTGYAGLQIFFSAQKGNGTLIFVDQKNFDQTCYSIVKHNINVISATPTFWRMLINSWPKSLARPMLEQLSMGGEIITQDIIDMCDDFFSPKQLTHIYASTEAGSAIAVSDKKAGFPISYLNSDRKIKLRIKKNMLEIKSKGRMKGYVGLNQQAKDGQWILTGDLIEIKNERCYFIGRNDCKINIGGSKVLPEEVEDVLNKLKGVEDCVVYEKKNPIVGSILAADIKTKSGFELKIPKIKTELSLVLPQFKIPQYYKKVENIGISENGKKIRS